MPQMLGDIVAQLLESLPDVEIVGRVSGLQNPLESAMMARADLLIVRDPTGTLSSILNQPGLSVLKISSDGKEGAMVQFAQHHMPLDHKSVSTIATLLRGKMAGRA
jgi:hypothetical protein